MNKRIFKGLFIILLFTFSFNHLNADEDTNVKDNNSKFKIILEDDADLLDNEEEELLYEKMKNLLVYGNIAFKTSNSNSYGSTDIYAENYYHSKFSNTSGTLFLIDMNKRNIFIFSDGNNYRVITKSKAYSITDNVYRYAKNGDYYNCAYEAFDQIETLLKGDKIYEPMRYVSLAFLSIILAAFINFARVLVNSKIKTATNKEIIDKCDVKFEVKDIVATKSGTHRVYRPRDSGSSGGGFSGGGGGGGHSGGGGGHSF